MKIEHPLPGDTAALRQLWTTVFADTDAFLDTFFSAAFFRDHCLCVKYDGVIAAAAYWMDCEIAGRKAAYIYAVATAEAYRGRGFCRALMENIHIILRDRGYCGSILVPGDAGLRRRVRRGGGDAADGGDMSGRVLCGRGHPGGRGTPCIPCSP